jgi:CheY-like chemotaxis protein
MPIWKRKQAPPMDPEMERFLSGITAMSPEEWAFALWASARQWSGEPLRERTVSEAIAVDPVVAAVVALCASPNEETKRAMVSATAARRASRLGDAIDAMAPTLRLDRDPEEGLRLIWLADSLVQLGAVAISNRANLSRHALERALGPFVELMDFSRILPEPETPGAVRHGVGLRVLVATFVPEWTARLVATLADLDAIGEVVTASTGVEALTAANVAGPDLAFVEVHLPELSGLEVTSELRRTHPRTFIVLLSIDNSAPTLQAAADSGANEFLGRPFPDKDVLEIVAVVASGRDSLELRGL